MDDSQQEKVSVNDCIVTLETQTFVCDGTAKTPVVTVKHGETVLVGGTDYTVSYENNVNVGTAAVVITGINGYTDTKKLSFSISLGSTVLSSTSSYGKITLTWNRVPGAGDMKYIRVQRHRRASSL